MHGDRQPAAAAGVSKVLDDDDLLIKIFLRVGFPTTLVRSALVCKRWLGHASDRAFLRRFRELHPPRLLGFYIEELGIRSPSFVPMLPQPPELANVIRHASFGRAQAITAALSKEDHGDISYFYLYVECTLGKPEYKVHIYVLHSGSWIPHHLFVINQHPHPLSERNVVIVNNKIYLPAGLSQIIVLDLIDSSVSTIQLPQGVEHGKRGTAILARADDASSLYAIHVEEFQLRIWLHKVDNWLLVDAICMREMCANLRISGCMDEDEHTALLINQVWDYSESVFFRMGPCALHLDIKSRTLRKVYETKEGHLGNAHPFRMIWPPTFPALKYDPARFVFWP
ncbi:uncharacterized protein LOC124648620 [Lolium rigidum]|uniref:uncharacterized protein LOC124648620 n=1 Tax=Lolium rigidum TaxID=89674 RepID=UPI001F5CB345|nr:uncharacterized protein LOC124648620 [Lolium rigidum]